MSASDYITLKGGMLRYWLDMQVDATTAWTFATGIIRDNLIITVMNGTFASTGAAPCAGYDRDSVHQGSISRPLVSGNATTPMTSESAANAVGYQRPE